jgi:N-acyl-D-amino-acid deacylase
MILIKNSLVVDGTGSKPQRLDVLIKDDRISAIGNFSTHPAEVVIDGQGMYLTPGFIDINTDSDHYLSLFSDPMQQDFLLQGVTSIIGGHCGSSLAPLLYGSLESIRKWGDENQVNLDWHSFAELFAILEKRRLGVNFGSLVGHSTIRRALIGNVQRDLTDAELEVFKKVLEVALREGALGLSTGLGYNHGRGTGYLEIKTLTDIVARYGGVYATHLRDEGKDVGKAVDETIQVAQSSKIKTLISHFRPIIGNEGKYEEALGEVERVGSRFNVGFDLYPFDYSIVPIYTLLPIWAQDGSLEDMYEQMTQKHTQEEVLKGITNTNGDDLVIARAPGFDYLVGKTLAQFAASREMKVKPALFELMKISKLRAVLFYRNINMKVSERALLSDSSFVASNSPSLIEAKNVLENQRAKETFTRFMSIAANAEKPLEWVIQKLTQKPAQFLGLRGRGVIAEGAFADLVLLKEGRAFDVWVAGRQVVKDGSITGVLAGSILKR